MGSYAEALESGRHRGLGRMLLAAALVLIAAACGNSDEATLDKRVQQTDGLLRDLQVDVVEHAEVTESKSVRYVTALATGRGDQQAVIRHVTDRLSAGGWTILKNEPIEAAGGPATEAHQLIASRDGLFVNLGIYDRKGSNKAPPGARWIDVSLSERNDALGWAKP